MLDKGLGAAPNPLAAEHWYLAAAEQGNALSQYLLGQFYQKGDLGQPDYALAMQWYQKAAVTHYLKHWLLWAFSMKL